MGENWMDKIRYDQAFKDALKSNEICRNTLLLYPPFRLRIELTLDEARKQGLNVGIFEAFRSAHRQAQLFRDGRTKIQTNGMHYYCVAADIVFKDASGAWTWNATPGHWKALGGIGKAQGLFWGGDWKSFKDCPHFQYVPATREAQRRIIQGDYPQ